MLREFGIPGTVAPVDPDNAAGRWKVYDTADPATRTDITADALAALAAAVRASGIHPGERGKGQGPTRGFIVPPTDD
ncbi:hypothetical protein GCM10010305_17880 [Streptomyces termitum]|uniref:Uncharacterized protein n=1 Tax=Streptomyces termitum TaxID=67368 RepID=A0A918SWH4_9ACTN|nr:hypothetical protein GCM10010305_17880 [Streptomyces termitum]